MWTSVLQYTSKNEVYQHSIFLKTAFVVIKNFSYNIIMLPLLTKPCHGPIRS